ncbi:NADP-dependent oxidoreductase [Nocardia sp. NPDC004068]|uniref:NADP-dependent oxidoreductase n=1 Tax=Nocardia sp. NPDC004068 TaxID=3364303 RepID=UPI0036D01218
MSAEQSMRAVVARGYGGPDVLELVELPVPEPGAGQVRIRVEAAAVNPVDLATRSGALVDGGLMAARPITGIGWDVAGTVDALGPGATSFTVGQSVIGLRDLLDVSVGAYAEYLVLDESAVAPAPVDVPASAAATLPLNGLTAAQALDRLALPAGGSLLITGAAGAVGAFAVELATRRGLRVVAQANAADEPFLRDIGAHWFLDREKPDLPTEVRRPIPAGADAALDTAGLGIRALAAVRTNGSYATVVGGPPPLPLRGITVHQIWIKADGPTLTTLATHVPTLRVAGTFPLDKAALAHRRLAEGRVRGRFVLTL